MSIPFRIRWGLQHRHHQVAQMLNLEHVKSFQIDSQSVCIAWATLTASQNDLWHSTHTKLRVFSYTISHLVNEIVRKAVILPRLNIASGGWNSCMWCRIFRTQLFAHRNRYPCTIFRPNRFKTFICVVWPGNIWDEFALAEAYRWNSDIIAVVHLRSAYSRCPSGTLLSVCWYKFECWLINFDFSMLTSRWNLILIIKMWVYKTCVYVWVVHRVGWDRVMFFPATVLFRTGLL